MSKTTKEDHIYEGDCLEVLPDLAENALEHGTGGLNVDDTRVQDDRYPSNVTHDGSVEAIKQMQGKHRYFYSPKAHAGERELGLEDFDKKDGNIPAGPAGMQGDTQEKSNVHPTVKPIELMQYLVRLITPEGGTVLDPFVGSGTTAIACIREGFTYVGIEKDPEYAEIAKARIEYWQTKEGNKLF